MSYVVHFLHAVTTASAKHMYFWIRDVLKLDTFISYLTDLASKLITTAELSVVMVMLLSSVSPMILV